MPSGLEDPVTLLVVRVTIGEGDAFQKSSRPVGEGISAAQLPEFRAVIGNQEMGQFMDNDIVDDVVRKVLQVG